MTTTVAQQVALDNDLVPLEKRVEIGKCNMRIVLAKTQKEPTYQVVLDALALTTCYPTFLITVDVPEIYMHQFRFTINKKDSTSYKFKIDKKMFSLSNEVLREIFQICPNLPNLEFDALSSDEEIVSFIKELGHKGEIKSITEVVVDHIAQILWGMLYNKNVDFVELLWEDITFQIENRDHKKNEKMYYPRFTKAIIHHFITKDKSISMRNKMFMHTTQDDSILGTMRFVSKSKDFQIYGASLPNRMTNQQMLDSDSYKTYLAYATSVASPKMKRKVKRPASPSKMRTLVTIEEEEIEPAKKVVPTKKPATKRQSSSVQIRDTPSVSVSKKKASAKVARNKGIKLLSDAALLEEAQLKKALERSKRETTIHQAGGSSEGADFKLEVPDEPKDKSIDTSKGTVLKPRVPDVSKGDSFESEYESWGDNGDKDNVQDDEEVQESDDEPQQVDDERNDSENQETNDDEEETEDEFVHTPQNYVPNYDETNDESKDDEEMTIAGHMNVNQEGAGNQVKDDAQATHKTEGPIPSSSISYDYAAKYLNIDSIPPTDTKVVSMMDINVQHEVPHTSSLLTILVSVIPEQSVINQFETVTTTSAPTIYLLLSSLYHVLQQITSIPTPTTTEATTSTSIVLDPETLTALHQRITDLEKDVKKLKDVDNSTKVISTIQSEVPKPVKEYLGSSLDEAMHKVIQKNIVDIIKKHSIPTETVERLRQQYAPQKSVKDIREIKIEHARKQQVPKETITSSDTTILAEFDKKITFFETMTKSKSFNKSPKQRALYHALMESILKDTKELFKKPERPPTLYPEWNTGKSVENKPSQKWLSDLAKSEKPSRTFDELMSTPIDFSAFIMNRLQISELTQDILVGPAYDILKGTC
ncbi:hypothetical protein Tco_1367603 [Tanacetum coccineum]